MSFADFLRLHRDVGNLGGGEHQRRRRADIPDAGRQMERDVPGEARAEGVEGENEDAVNDLEVLPAVEDDDDDDDDGNGNDQLDIELHAAVDDLLGIRGPTLILLRNLVCLLAFNCAYLGLFAFIPFSIGSSIVLAARSYVELAGMSINGLGIKTHHSEWLAGSIGILTEISVISSKEGHTLQLIDLVMIVFGYLVISSAIFTWQYILRYLDANAAHIHLLLTRWAGFCARECRFRC
jgi:E3 ubiquitin-protein ligase MARCH6